MVVAMAVVISKHPAIVHATNPEIDVRKAVPNNLTVLRRPHFLFQLRTLPWPRQRKFCVECFRDLRGLLGCFLPHYSSIPQKGSYKPQLNSSAKTRRVQQEFLFPLQVERRRAFRARPQRNRNLRSPRLYSLACHKT